MLHIEAFHGDAPLVLATKACSFNGRLVAIECVIYEMTICDVLIMIFMERRGVGFAKRPFPPFDAHRPSE